MKMAALASMAWTTLSDMVPTTAQSILLPWKHGSLPQIRMKLMLKQWRELKDG